MWLKPGQKYLFGRVKREGVQFAIDHKTVSRKHFVIEVDPVKEGDVGRVHARTKVTIIDQNSKSGTSVNGELIKGGSRELKNADNSVRPGSYHHELLIRWHPCVLTFNLLKKEVRAGVLKSKQDRVQGLDVKAICDFLPDRTTHLVAAKRNTAKGLQALITGKHLVTESFVDAIEYAATPADLSQEENLSALESDFDRAWPNPRDHLPAAGKEPTTRPVESYEPDPSRTTIFEDYIFVFGDQTQYDNLLPVVTSGHGKALLLKVTNGETTVEEAVQWMQNAAGQKAVGMDRDDVRGGAILVRWHGKDDFQEWTSALIDGVALKLGQRAIDQSEFLDAILANDASLLKQAVPPTPSVVASLAAVRPPSELESHQTSHPSPTSNRPISSSEASLATAPECQIRPGEVGSRNSASQNGTCPRQNVSAKRDASLPPVKRARFRATQTSRLKDFDDGFDPDAIIAYDNQDEEASPMIGDAGRPEGEQMVDVKEERLSTSKKRPRSSSPEQMANSFQEEMDHFLPAATSLKRQKLAMGAEAGRNGQRQSSTNGPVVSGAAKRSKRKTKEIDVLEIAKAQRKDQEEADQKELDDLEAGISFANDGKPAKLAVIVSTDLPVRHNKGTRASDDHQPSDRWDPRWNGRKNFKKFRPQGEGGPRRGVSNKVIVPLVEVKRNTYGIGEQYWEKSLEEKERSKERRRREQEQPRSQSTTSQSQIQQRSQHTDNYDDEDDETVLTPTTSSRVVQSRREAAEATEHDIDPDAPNTRAVDGSARSSPEVLNQSWSSTATRKRPAASVAGRATKKQKTLPVTVVHGSGSDDDSDDLKFRFGARTRRGKGKA